MKAVQIGLLWLCISGGIRTVGAEELDQWRKTYYDLLQKSQLQLDTEQRELGGKYRSALKDQLKRFQEVGELNAVLHVQEIIKRTEREGKPASMRNIQRDPYLAELRKVYHRAWYQALESASAREGKIREAYVNRLQLEVVRLTKAGEIETAIRIRAEIEEIRRLGDVPENQTVRNTVLEFENSRYIYVENAVSWQEAKALAVRMGGHLWIIDSKEEWEAVKAISGNKRAWVGAYEVEPGQWKWVNGTDLDRKSGLRYRFSSKNQSEPALTLARGGILSDAEEEANPRKVKGFIMESQ